MPSNPFRATVLGPSTAAGSVTWPTTTGFGGYPIFFPDYAVRPFNIGVGITLTATATSIFNVEHTFDYTGSSAFISSNATWLVNTGINQNSCSIAGNYAYPVSAIRLNVTNGSTTTSVNMTLISAG